MKKPDGIIVATFLTTLFYASTYPYINKFIISNVSESMIALNQIVNCGSIIIFSSLWNKIGEKLFKFYPVYLILEIVVNLFMTIYAITTGNIVAYYLLDTLVFSVITRNIICGGIKLRAKRYNSEEKRSIFDNTENIAYAAATICGSLIAMFMSFDFTKMLIIATVGNCIDNIFYVVIYNKTMKGE